MIRFALAALLASPLPAAGQILSFPGNAVLASDDSAEFATFALPTAAWSSGAIPTRGFEGAIARQAWRIDATGLETLQLLRPLREQVRNAGFEVLFECETEACGGFDFRFALDLIRPPAMQVNLADFRYLAAVREEDASAVGILVSRTPDAGFIHLTRVGPPDEAAAVAAGPPLRAEAPGAAPGSLSEELDSIGRHVLDGLTFETCSAQLSAGQFPSLGALADYLAENPDLKVALVGHTDSSGSLDGNIALSKRRAASVLERLVSSYGVDRLQLDAQGMGYLSPVASNLTEEGRTLNRRVEVIVTSTE